MVASMSVCSLCGASLTPVLDECVHWQVRLNLNQNLLGKLIIVLRRHEEHVVALTADEWTALHKQVRLMTARLRAAFAPKGPAYDPPRSDGVIWEHGRRNFALRAAVGACTNT